MHPSVKCRQGTAADRPPSNPGSLAARLRSLRLSARLSQTDLASLSHIPQSHISAFESGARRPGRRRAARIAAVLGVEVQEILA